MLVDTPIVVRKEKAQLAFTEANGNVAIDYNLFYR